MNIDLDRFKLTETRIKPKERKKRKDFPSKQFLMGPIPLDWLKPIFLNHRYLTPTCLAVWHLFNLNKMPISFKFSYEMAFKFGVKRTSAWRGLKKLNELGLISILEQSKGKSPVISLNCEKLRNEK